MKIFSINEIGSYSVEGENIFAISSSNQLVKYSIPDLSKVTIVEKDVSSFIVLPSSILVKTSDSLMIVDWSGKMLRKYNGKFYLNRAVKSGWFVFFFQREHDMNCWFYYDSNQDILEKLNFTIKNSVVFFDPIQDLVITREHNSVIATKRLSGMVEWDHDISRYLVKKEAIVTKIDYYHSLNNNSLLCVSEENFTIFAIDLSNGQLLWQKQDVLSFGFDQIELGILYCKMVHTPKFVLIDAYIGSVLSEYELTYWPSLFSPMIQSAIIYGNYIFLPSWYAKIYILDKTTGKLIHEFATAEKDNLHRNMILKVHGKYLFVHHGVSAGDTPLEIYNLEEIMELFTRLDFLNTSSKRNPTGI